MNRPRHTPEQVEAALAKTRAFFDDASRPDLIEPGEEFDPVYQRLGKLDDPALLKLARDGDWEADALLRLRMQNELFHLDHLGKLPKRLFPILSELLLSDTVPSPRGPGRCAAENSRRDFLIALAIEHLKVDGFDPTSSPASKNTSACSIVAQVLGLNERAVVKVWGKKKRKH
jgi:hypothetical protein